jgi:hypothetical protein
LMKHEISVTKGVRTNITLNRVNVFKTDMTMRSDSEVSPAVTTLNQLQQYTVF